MSGLWEQIPSDSLAVLNSYMDDYYIPSIGTDKGIVMIAGTQTITGDKTFSAATKFSSTVTFNNIPVVQMNSPGLWFRDSSITKGTAPSSTKYNILAFYDSQGFAQANKVAQIFTQVTSANECSLNFNAFKYANASTDACAIRLIATSNAVYYATAPNSDVAGSILTTVNKSKGLNGYFKLGNGMLLQWGRYTYSDGGDYALTFPTPFSGNNWQITFGHELNADSHCDYYGPQIRKGTRSSTGCKIYSRNASTARSSWELYIAVGY